MLFTEGKLGPVLLRNRSIRSAAFEGMCPDNRISENLIRYHTAVAAGGIGMTTVAFASVAKSGLSFPHQLLLTRDAIPGLRRLTDAVHREGAAAAIQIGHGGLMADKSVSHVCLAPTGGLSLYGPAIPRTITMQEIKDIVRDFGTAAKIASESGFDVVEIQAGHGYLISQFLSPYTNRRTDVFGGTYASRSRFLIEVIREVIKSTDPKVAIVVKINLRDGFPGGIELDEAILTARLIEQEGIHGLVLSGGSVSKNPVFIMRGAMPFKALSGNMGNPLMKLGMRWFGKYLMKQEPYKDAYFLEDALQLVGKVKMPLILVGGLKSKLVIENVLEQGFDFVQIARALIHDPGFINKLKTGELTVSGCQCSNTCTARMYSGEMTCYQHDGDAPES